MKMRLKVLVPLGLLLLAATWLFWPRGGDAPSPAQSSAAPAAVVAAVAPVAATNAAPATNAVAVTRSFASTNRVAFRLTNTSRTLDEMIASPRAILLENALVDTAEKLELNIPKHLRAAAEPGAFIVQAQGPVTAAFRAALKGAGAEIVSYIPNNAYLVQLSGAGAGALAGHPLVRAVLPYEPYFKVQATLLGRAVEQKPLPEGQVLTLGLFAGGAQATMEQIENLGGRILVVDRSPFGPVVRVRPATDWLALAQLPGVQRVEPATRRQIANDLARVTMNLTTDAMATNQNWMGLSGSNVLVVVNDTGIDPGHLDFATSRVTGYDTNSLEDIDGHGTHVAGIIAGNGAQSATVLQVPSGSVTNADFRGKAPLAKLFSVGFLGPNDTNTIFTDAMLQEIPALTNALICNNSWVNSGAFEYDLSASSYDAAVRDALPGATGPQPVLYVFAAGNAGRSEEPNGIGGVADSIMSPATAKNVITVGALEQFRNITNEVTSLDGQTNEYWLLDTDSSTQVADYSSRGNVGIFTEGTYGRFKPDLVAPGTFVVSTRPSMWDKAAYYNPTNYHYQYSQYGLIVTSNQLAYGGGAVPINGVGLTITVEPNRLSPVPFPTNFPIYFTLAQNGLPGPTNYDVATSNNVLAIPPGGGLVTTIGPLLNNGFNCSVGSPTNIAVNFDLVIQVATTNDEGNKLFVLSNLNETLGSSYYYESGTSMAAPAVSGALALLQDFFVNQRNPAYATNPSPALLKAMLINGARLTPGYNDFALTNTMNYEGWGLVDVPNTLPASLTNTTPGASLPVYLLDQNPTNALATGDSRTYNVSIPTALARAQGLRFTLVWTDPPGNPSAGLKLVNNLDLVVTNLDNPTNPVVFYGNVFGSGTFSSVVDSNTPPDAVNNVENIWLNGPLGTNYAVTVLGRNVAVNAVTAEQTNVVQDFALVITGGNNVSTNGFIVTPVAPVPATAVMPQVTFVDNFTNGIYFNQLAGANAPWLSTNAIAIDPANVFGTNASLFVGQTNQWHFYVVTNTTTFSNAAFIIFLPQTQSEPRMGVFTYSRENATREEADLNLFVASDPDPNPGTLTNLNLTVISNCVYNVNGDRSSLERGGTKFIAYSNAVPQQVYYIGVQCQDQLAANYGFLAVFSEKPFSTLNPDGSQTVNGLLLPAPIPDGTPELGGVAYVFGLALYPMEMDGVTVTNTITHQNYGDLIGILNHNNTAVVLNNHDALGSVVNLTRVYNDDGLAGTETADGPGTLRSFKGKEAVGPWFLTQVDDALNQTGSITGFSLNIQPHKDLEKQPFTTVSVPPGGWWFGYVDADVGYTNLLVVATNNPPTSVPPIQLYLNYDTQPDFNNYLVRADLTNAAPGLPPYPDPNCYPGNSISYGPPLQPGRYFVGLFNPDIISHQVLIGVILSFNASAISEINWEPGGVMPLLDDAVTNSYLFVTDTDRIQDISVGLRVDHERISDLVFHLISPDGTRYLLMENRGGQTTNGAGATIIMTNIVNVATNGTAAPFTNVINVGMTSGTFPITYNFYTAPDQMTVYYGNSTDPANLIFDTGLTNNPPDPNLPPAPQNTLPRTIYVNFPPPAVPATSSDLTIVINQFGNTNTTTAWTYTAGGVITNHYYLTFTEDTNLTTTPIKYAVPPFAPSGFFATNFALGGFEPSLATNYVAPATIIDVNNWAVLSNQVSVVADAANAQNGSNFLTLASGAISNSIPTMPGESYNLTFNTRGPGIVGWWRGESNALDSIYGNNGTLMNGATFTNGEVGTAFNLGSPKYVQVPDSSLWAFGSNNFTIEFWANFNSTASGTLGSPNGGLFIGNDEGAFSFNKWFFARGGGRLEFHINSPTINGGAGVFLVQALFTPVVNQWYHLAVTRNGSLYTMYVNGTRVGSQVDTNVIPDPNAPLTIGQAEGLYFNGKMDEVSIYNRAISESELKAIYQAGAAGKFDPALVNSAAAQSLSEARVVIPGSATNVFYGNNTIWQARSVTFTASGANTPVIINGIQPGMLLDNLTLSAASAGELYYHPEESLESLIGTSPYGLWTLEILDNRAGATNNANLVSWQLNFTYANTNYTTGINTNPFTGPVTNFIPGGGLQWYLINVPTNADISTNSLLFASLPLHMWWSTNVPPTVTNVTDVQLLNNSTGGSALLFTNGSPFNTTTAFLETGGWYYLGIQNTNVAGANYALDVTFHLNLSFSGPTVVTEPATNIVVDAADLQAEVTPNSTNTTVYFDYGTTTNYGSTTASIVLTSNYSLAQWVVIGISNLTQPGIWHYRAVGYNIYGTNYGADLTFTNPYTVPPPYAFTMPATLVNGSSAQLNGMATPNGYDATAWFEWGTSPAYTSNTPPVNVGTNFNVVYVTNQIAGLVTNVAIHYRLVVSNAVGVTYGFDQVFAQGSVLAWGSGFAGQTTPIPSGLTNLVVGAGAGFDFSLALNYDGAVVAWGDDSSGQTNVPAGLNNAVAVDGGVAHSLALRSDRTVMVWGDDTYNQTNVPVDLTNAVAAASGGHYWLALRDTGVPLAWGRNNNGQTNLPAGLSNVVAVVAGYAHCLALKNDGTVVAWGSNAQGQTNVPAGLTNVVAIAAGHDDSLALRKDGTIVAWGSNANGQTNVPTSLTNVTAIAAGDYHCLALKGDGSVWFWGDSSSGQLNPYGSPWDPYQFGLTNVFAIAGGGFHTVAVKAPYGLNVTNTAPYWTNGLAGATVTMDEMTSLSITNAALDNNSPPQVVFYSLINPPAFVSIDSFKGIITCNPQEEDGPTNVVITMVAADNGFPVLKSTNSFTLVVNEVNRPPFWTNGVPAVINFTIGTGQMLTVTNTASDPDIPLNTLTYSTTVSPSNSAPAISSSGVITWVPSVAGTFTLMTIVTDFNAPALVNQNLTATNYLTVIVTNGPVPPPVITNINISTIVYTNGGFLLTWFAPSNYLFEVQWTDSLAPQNWQSFTNPSPVSYNTNFPASATNATFTFFDDGSQAPFTGMRFYRLLLVTSAPNVAPVFNLGATATRYVTPTYTFTVTNAATDANAGQTLTYALVSPPVGVNIDTNTGVITWTNVPLALAGTTNNTITTVVTDNGSPALSATNVVTVWVNPIPSLTSVTFGTNGTTLQWTGWTNEQFQVQWATNLVAPVTWTPFPGTITSTNGTFIFVDTNAPLWMKFYQLILLP